jgi:hypothetical protein
MTIIDTAKHVVYGVVRTSKRLRAASFGAARRRSSSASWRRPGSGWKRAARFPITGRGCCAVWWFLWECRRAVFGRRWDQPIWPGVSIKRFDPLSTIRYGVMNI